MTDHCVDYWSKPNLLKGKKTNKLGDDYAVSFLNIFHDTYY